MRSLSSRLNAAEAALVPTEDKLMNNAISNLLVYGLLDKAIDLMQQGNRAAMYELIVSSYTNCTLTPAQIHWSIDFFAANLDWHIAQREEARARPAKEAAQRERDLRADAALLARNRRNCGWPDGPATDEETIYADLVRKGVKV